MSSDEPRTHPGGRVRPLPEALIDQNEWFRRNGVRLSCVDKTQDAELRALMAAPFEGVKVWICKRDDYQPTRSAGRGRRPSHAPNA